MHLSQDIIRKNFSTAVENILYSSNDWKEAQHYPMVFTTLYISSLHLVVALFVSSEFGQVAAFEKIKLEYMKDNI